MPLLDWAPSIGTDWYPCPTSLSSDAELTSPHAFHLLRKCRQPPASQTDGTGEALANPTRILGLRYGYRQDFRERSFLYALRHRPIQTPGVVGANIPHWRQPQYPGANWDTPVTGASEPQ
jgi:hypothetical protein